MVKCNHPECNKQANFNNPGEKKGMFCAEHKKEGMVDVKNQDVLKWNDKRLKIKWPRKKNLIFSKRDK